MNGDVSSVKQGVGAGLWKRAVAGDGAALETLAERYWYPAYVWLRMAGNESSDAAFQILSFFARLQTTHAPKAGEPGAGRLREFILARLKEFAAEDFPAAEGMPTFLLDVADAERRFAQEPAKAEDDLFARRWSLTILENTLIALRTEYEQQEKVELFTALKPFLGFHKGDEAGYAEAAAAIGMSSSALHIAAYNFRIRYRELLRAMVVDTVRDSDDVDSELTVLLVGAS